MARGSAVRGSGIGAGQAGERGRDRRRDADAEQILAEALAQSRAAS